MGPIADVLPRFFWKLDVCAASENEEPAICAIDPCVVQLVKLEDPGDFVLELLAALYDRGGWNVVHDDVDDESGMEDAVGGRIRCCTVGVVAIRGLAPDDEAEGGMFRWMELEPDIGMGAEDEGSEAVAVQDLGDVVQPGQRRGLEVRPGVGCVGHWLVSEDAGGFLGRPEWR